VLFRSQADAFKSHDHDVTESDHSHTYTRAERISTNGQAGGSAHTPLNTLYAGTATSSVSTGLTVDERGDTETRPVNIPVYTYIKY
jgi:activator of HSP90 ATPase